MKKRLKNDEGKRIQMSEDQKNFFQIKRIEEEEHIEKFI
jgi:hypothetical protein